MLLVYALVIFFVSFYGLQFTKYPTKTTHYLFLGMMALSIAFILMWIFDLLIQQGAI